MSKLKVEFKAVNKDKGILQLSNARLGFYCLWEENEYKGKATGRQVCNFIFSKDEMAEYKKVMAFALAVYRKQFGDAEISALTSDAEYPRFVTSKYNKTDKMLKTTNSEKRPAIYIDGNGRKVSNPQLEKVEHKLFYMGCRVNVKIQFTTSKGDDRIWSNLIAIQFAGDDEPFGGLSVEEAMEGFGTVEGAMNDDMDFDSDSDYEEQEAAAAKSKGKGKGKKSEEAEEMSENDMDDLFGDMGDNADDVPF